MKLLKTLTITISILIFSLLKLSGQEIWNLNYNHAILNYSKVAEKANFSPTKDSIAFDTLFFEDFSNYHYEIFPRSNRWENYYAFINSTYPKSMISLGVATLDAIDSKGFPYYTSINKVVPSDTLTSRPFKFSSTPESMYFGFFYQAGGLGDIPEGNDTTGGANGDGRDTLLLEFYNPDTEKWNKVYHTLNNSNPDEFFPVVVPVETMYQKNGFKFRFRNYTSAEVNNNQSDLGMVSNNDLWHIDYIRMMTTTDSLDLIKINDICLTQALQRTISSYTAVPYHHFVSAQAIDERKTIPLNISVGFPDIPANELIPTYRIYKSYNLKTGEEYRDIENKNDLLPENDYEFDDYFLSGFEYNPYDSIGKYELVAYIETNSIDQPKENDTIKRTEIYYDHYAYDDGTAEKGIGIGGEQSSIRELAVRFRTFKNVSTADSLHALLIYFTKSINDASADAYFSISIRNNKNGKPGDIELYNSGNAIYLPDYTKGLNGFSRIPIKPAITVADTFFVVIQENNGFVGIGYDINNDNSKHLYARTSTTPGGDDWQSYSNLQGGSLMVRPSFRMHDIITPIPETEMSEPEIQLYPNPVKDYLHFTTPDDNTSTNFQVQIYNVMGGLLADYLPEENKINISNFPTGFYLAKFYNSENNKQQTIKFYKE